MPDARSIGDGRSRQSTLIKQACDACKLRKVKCIYDNSFQTTNAASNSCQRCLRLFIECTFSLPQKCRGPRRRRDNVSKNNTATASSGPTSTGSPSFRIPQPVLRTGSLHQPGAVALEPSGSVDLLSRSVPSRSVSDLLDNDASAPVNGLLPTTPASLSDTNACDTTNTPVHRSYQTDSLCSRELLNRIMSDYLDIMYPVVPVVHRPSLRRDLAAGRDACDSDFFLLLVGICAVTLALCSSRFEQYRLVDPTLPFQTPEAMINHCYDLLVCHRGASYYDQVSHQKWAVSYCFVTAFFQIGHHNRSRMLEIESMQLARLLELHRASKYEGLDLIEAQLRRKAFWLIFYSLVHNKLQFARRERLLYLDCSMLRSIDFQALLPAEVEDEYITPDAILPRPQDDNHTNIITAFNIHSKVFCTALMPLWRVADSTSINPTRADSDRCCGCECLEVTLQVQSLEDRFEELRFMLDKCPSRLRPWAPIYDEASHRTTTTHIINAQMEVLRANIHVTHLWLQSVILDKIDGLRLNNPSLPGPDPKTLWSRREEVARQMLHVLHSFSDEPLEPNGYHTFCKIRDVAVSLLNCPFEEDDRVAVRANEYLHRFTEILWRLDKSELLNSLSLQNWIDTGRRE